jgi:hypothetical protein
MKAIDPPVPLIVTKCWLKAVAPVFALSLVLLQAGLKRGDGIDLSYRDAGFSLKMTSTRIAEMLNEVGDDLAEMGISDLLVRLRRNLELHAEDIRQLNGSAYELIADVACEDRGWRDRMEPVRKSGSSQVLWVSRDVANNTSHGYHIVHR